MKIYIDYVFIENFLITYILLIECEMLTNTNSHMLNKLISSTVSALYVCAMLIFKLNVLNYIICKLCLFFIIVYLSFFPKKICKYLKQISIFFVINVINLGVFYITKSLLGVAYSNIFLKICTYLINLSICFFVCNKVWKFYTLKLVKDNLIYDVIIKLGKCEYKYKGFVDTGNCAFSLENNIPIVIAEIQNLEQKKNIETLECFFMNIGSINGEKEQKIYISSDFWINAQKLKVGIMFLDQKLDMSSNYNMILNFEMFKNNMRGINV